MSSTTSNMYHTCKEFFATMHNDPNYWKVSPYERTKTDWLLMELSVTALLRLILLFPKYWLKYYNVGLNFWTINLYWSQKIVFEAVSSWTGIGCICISRLPCTLYWSVSDHLQSPHLLVCISSDSFHLTPLRVQHRVARAQRNPFVQQVCSLLHVDWLVHKIGSMQ